MKVYNINPNEKGWLSISGDTKVIVAHYKDGHREKMELYEFLSNSKRLKNVVRIDCYTEEERKRLGL